MSKSKRSCQKKISKILRDQDMYGHQINLTYKNSSTFKSTFGGISTLIMRIAILAYLVSQLIQVINKNSTLTTTEKIRNLIIDDY